MKLTTRVHGAFRNIGDSQDTGQMFEGTAKELIEWLAIQIVSSTMATRFVIGIGRNEDDARSGINVARAGKAKVTDDMKSMLDDVFAKYEIDSEEEEYDDSNINRDPLDTYVP